MSTRQKLESRQVRRMIHQPVSVVSQCGAGAWLADISTDLREVVAHLSDVCDEHAQYKSTVTLHYTNNQTRLGVEFRLCQLLLSARTLTLPLVPWGRAALEALFPIKNVTEAPWDKDLLDIKVVCYGTHSPMN